MTKKKRSNQSALFNESERNIHSIEGVVDRVFFSNERFSAGTLETKTHGSIRIRGNTPLLSPGMKLTGKWSLENDPKWGEQYEAITVYVSEDVDELGGLEAFLRQKVKGIGPKTAAAIINKYGDEALKALDDPAKLNKVKGIGKALAEEIPSLWEEVKDEYMQLRSLFTLGLPYYQAKLAIEHFGNSAHTVLTGNIYKLTDVSGIGFKFADKIALDAGMDPKDPRRLAAVASFALTEALGDGHTIIDEPLYLKYVDEKTDISQSESLEGLRLATESGEITHSYRNHYALKYVAEAEMEVMKRINELATSKGDIALDPKDDQLTEEQREIFTILGRNRLAVLTGGPGVGKTRTVSALVESAIDAGIRFSLAAPTGKAARRMSELSGEEASTIHRLLMWQPTGGFFYGADNPLPDKLVIIDESSMVDVFLMRSLLRAIGPHTVLLLVGDADQLPPVGPGQPFAHAHTNVVRLTRIFRQAQENPIIMAAHSINNQRFPEFPGNDSRLSFQAHEEADDVLSALLEQYDKLSGLHGEAPQVLSPMNVGPLGVKALNLRLKEHVNPGVGTPFYLPGNQEVHKGDIVIQTKNDYEVGLMNGEQGTVLTYNDEEITLRTPLGDLVLTKSQAKNLQLAYAITIHKSQGSQWKSCILLCHTSHFVMLSKELMYTGLTRASEAAMFIGKKQALAMSLRHRMSERKSIMAFTEAWDDVGGE